MQPRGFTLIELLVVIAIISILASILYPVFARAREQARKANCLSNLRQIGMAVQMYAQDYDEFLPQVDPREDNDGSDWDYCQPLHVLLEPYVRNRQLFRCKSDATWYRPLAEGGHGWGVTSYGWVVLFNGTALGMPQPLSEPTFLGIDLTPYPFLLDADNFHDPKAEMARNGVWLDGHAKFINRMPEGMPGG
jgi:prepilin-type N-terminal cleavage/methylation domain-containing protein